MELLERFHLSAFMKKIILIAVCLTGLTIAAVMANGVNPRSEKFVKHWVTTFKKCPNLKAVKSLPNAYRIYIRTFKNGEWVAISMEHECCSGAGFNATVFYDSQHKMYADTTYSFCGLEGLAGELGEIKATSLKAFYPSLTQLKLRQLK